MMIALASTHHDPEGLLIPQTRRILPRLRTLYAHMVVITTPTTHPATFDLFHQHNAMVEQSNADLLDAHLTLGRWRRRAVELAMRPETITHIHLCDFDRVLHWADFHFAELQCTLNNLHTHDFKVFGRTPRAYDTHPRVQRDTELLINHAFRLACGESWDVGAASRGLSRRAAAAIVADCPDDTIGCDISWPLHVRRSGLTLTHTATEGLEFETLDRFAPEIAASYCERMDADLREWTRRIELARVEAESAAKYGQP